MEEFKLIYEGYDPQQEGLRESLCTLGNGYFATRGACPECSSDKVHYPGTYLAGGYNRLKTDIKDKVIENEDLVNMPNWLYFTFRINGGKWFCADEAEILNYRQVLDIEKGILHRDIEFRDEQGNVTELKSKRIVHMGNSHLAALQTSLTAKNWSGKIEFYSALDGSVINGGVDRYNRLNNKHLELAERGLFDDKYLFLKVQTSQSRIAIAQAAKHTVYKNGKNIGVEFEEIEKPELISCRFGAEVSQDDTVTVDKVVSFFTSRDRAISECGLAAKKQIRRAENFDELLESHITEWRHLWNRFDLCFYTADDVSEDHMQSTVRLYTFHLLQTTSRHSMDMDIGVPSRGWHGEAYRGHILWDELLIFPLLNYRMPDITRSLLMYRYRRLDEARINAEKNGYKGAMYPWQSGSSGREESQKIHLNPVSNEWIPDNSQLQRHVNSAIVYNICMYYQATEDIEFMSYYGAEMIWEIARFWSSIAKYNEDQQRYEILDVMGPDEFHDSFPGKEGPGLDNNAYTNICAVWVLLEALKLFKILSDERIKELRETIGLDDEELKRWKDITHKMKVCFHDGGIISQFEGYDQLKEFDWEGYNKKYGNIQRLDRILDSEGDSPNNYKLSKQADVLMLFYLFTSEQLECIFDKLGYTFEYETIPKNIDYYLNRTSHGSTLSWIVHSWVLTRSDRKGSWHLFTEALKSDVADIQGGTTPEGIHLGAMAGTVNILQISYTGLRIHDDILWFNPMLPDELACLKMLIRYRGHTLRLSFEKGVLKITAVRVAKRPVKIGLDGEVYELESGKSKEFQYKE